MVYFNIPLFCIFAFLSVVENKKYDVEVEAQKLYGQNLALVLARFRKTADYLKILTDKAKDLNTELLEVAGQIWNYYVVKMRDEIKESVGLNTVSTTDEPTSPGSFRSMKKKVARRQDVTEINAEQQKKVDRIDNYQKLSNFLTLKERNEYKDLGFKYIGDAIHLIIEKMGVEVSTMKSTRMPDGGDPPKLRQRTTTEHARDHRVTKEPRAETVSVDSTGDKTR
ncbi:uncharacterized protein isoform X2 [Choristoneura fumiferana]|uniref:uncharacterized protein isoform X2 n=1 Tax=Choristoneura fumiferana TaxID=7141 RepID=UPI003D15AAE5